PDFLDSDYCYDKEMERALERHRAEEAWVVPILLRPVDWRGTPFSTLQMLPSTAQGPLAVTLWSSRDEAFETIARGISKVIDDLRSRTPARLPQQLPPVSTIPVTPTPPVIQPPSPPRPQKRQVIFILLAVGLAFLVASLGVFLIFRAY